MQLELFAHQKDAIKFSQEAGGSVALFHDPGLGKTRTGLEIFFNYYRVFNPTAKLLVVCPISLIEMAWINDMKKFFPDQNGSYWNCNKYGVPTLDKSNKISDILIINYEMLQRKERLEPLVKILREFNFMVILDESSKIKNHSALTTKNLLLLRPFFQQRIVMSGTPAPNSEEEYWAQIEFIAPGTFGPSFPKFKRTYFHLERNGQPVLPAGSVLTRQVMQELYRTGAKYVISKENRAKLFDKMKPFIHVRKKEDCLDLPEQIDEIRLVKMGPKQAQSYKEMRSRLVTEINGGQVVAQMAMTKIMKLREITSGFAVDDQGKIVETESPKLSEIECLLDELGDRQAIIWCNFTWEIGKVVELLAARAKTDKAGVAAFLTETLYGETKDKDVAIRRFTDGTARYLVANPHSAAHGLTFVNCSQQIFFSLDYSWEAYEQARARTHRAGQKNTCVYHHILADGTIDQQILEVLRRKGDMQELVAKL